MEIQPGLFTIGDREDVHLAGTYNIKIIRNKMLLAYDVAECINCQLVYDVGKVFYRTNTVDIESLIDVFIRYTYDPCIDLDLDFSFKQENIMIGDTICPTKKVLFVYRGKVFVAYGRYIYGYDNFGCEIIKRIVTDGNLADDSHNSSDSEEEESYCEDDDDIYFNRGSDKNVYKEADTDNCKGPDLVSNDMIILRAPVAAERRVPRSDHYYSFMIYDKATLVMDAFGLYW